jgi:hypothetical protein
VIQVVPAKEPPSFNVHVRKRGNDAIARLLGKPVKGTGGRKRKNTYTRAEDIPSKKFPTLWVQRRKADGKSTLDDMMALYGQQCAYLAMYIETATGSPTVDHFIAQSTNWQLVYEWSNYRLSAACVNSAKGVLDVVDPFDVRAGWFELNLATFHVQQGRSAPAAQQTKIDNTLRLLNQRECWQQRKEYVECYRSGPGKEGIDLTYLQRRAPFLASELRRQGQLVRGDT